MYSPSAWREIGKVQCHFPPDKIVGNHDAANGTEERTVADQPGEDVTAGIRHQLPWHDEDTDQASDETANAEGDFARGQLGEVVGGADDVGGDVGGQSGEAEREHGEDEDRRIFESCQDIDGIPQGLAEDDGGGGSHGDTDEGIQRHGQRQSQGLAEHLVALGNGVAGEVRNIQRQRGPKPDHTGKGWQKEHPKLPGFRLAGIKAGRLGEHGAEAARFLPRPPEQNEAERQKERRFDVQQEADGVDAFVNHPHVDPPEEEEA